MDELCPDRLDIEKLTGSEQEISLFENGKKTSYKQAIHTLDAAKIAEGRLISLFCSDFIQICIFLHGIEFHV